MRIADLFRRGRPVFSFEFFPPRTEAGVRSLFRTLDDLRRLEPDFVSVTYPLDRSRRHLTLEIVTRIRDEVGLEAMAHLTCVNASREEIHRVLEGLRDHEIHNVLALGGDPPAPESRVVPEEESFRYASELAAYAREHFGFCLGGAAHPEKHPAAPDFETDLGNLKRKVQAGCEFLITQLYFDNEDYFRLVERARAIGIEVPIVPGIMPITSLGGILRMAEINGSSIPAKLHRELQGVEADPEATEEIGVAYARSQCEELLQKGVPGIHFYTLNRSAATRKILEHLRKTHLA